MLEHAYNMIVNCVVKEPRHRIDVDDGLNETYKQLLSMLMTTVILPNEAAYESQMVMHTSTANTDII